MPVPQQSVRLPDLLPALVGPAFVLDRERRVVDANDAGRGAVLAIPGRELVLGTSMDDLAEASSVEAFRQRAEEALSGRTSRVLRDIRYPSGITRRWEVLYLPVRGASGDVDGLVFASRNVETDDEAHDRMHLLERALASAVVGVTLSDARQPDDPLVYVNPAFEVLTGYAASEVRGRNCRFLQRDDRDQPGLSELATALRERRSARVRLRNYRKDGTLFWNELTVSPVRDDAGVVTHFVGIQDDVTDVHVAHGRLARAARSEAAGQLATGIAHDVNNLLALVQLQAEELESSPDPRARDAARDLGALAHSTSGVLRRLLAFARDQTGALAAVDLGALVARIGPLLRPLLGAAVDLVVLPAPECLEVRVDPSALEQVIVNLAVNARHAMPRGGALRIELHARRDGDRRWGVVEVTDTGSGIDPSEIDRIWEPFFTTRATSGGTGLGLSTSRHLVREAGGELEVESELGRGTTFRVLLPLVDAASAEGTEGQLATAGAQR